MRRGYVLSGEHEEIPIEELKALLEIYNYKGKIEKVGRYAITENTPSKKIVSRGGYIDEGHKIVFEFKFSEKEYEDENKLIDKFISIFEENVEIPSEDLNSSKSFAVRVLKLHKDEFTKKLNSLKIEREIGRIIKTKTNAKVNLENPDVLIRVVILKDRFFVSTMLAKRDREYFQKNRPHLRKYFHPGCMLPKLARAMVNLARVKENDIILDPFCGTGGFLIEAGLIGAKLIGCDIDWRMASGTKINLEEYNLLDKIIKIERLDAKHVDKLLKNVGIEKVDAIITDPPYGISTAKKGEIEEILKILPNFIKKGGYFVFAYPKKVDLDMELKGIYKVYIHKKLIRHIHVYKRS
ncbi:putative RNA methylase [Methanocaldococcus vulcanius M7]|uniref:tRNA (guanine(10)-N(2))-dimethyltransferase n=1 Tax=Methanocaldococcus vulcanius (strain ATCC 700851 / DSM 12094 / M7) TaxID=579137 RepID=C9RIA5_METVM|nr:TIGR01177 family methyltransferase [Methanocaldococcus vulcanius]ACX73307.1 putative RNA methylase [Methanocaldococcus vulcanius M7]